MPNDRRALPSRTPEGRAFRAFRAFRALRSFRVASVASVAPVARVLCVPRATFAPASRQPVPA